MPQQMTTPGTLYIVATPIGNLEDITLRALRVLSQVNFIAAEDTRHTLKLLNHYGIKTPLISYFQHSGPQKTRDIVSRIASGESCALVSDAGMPLISDPGEELVSLCRKSGVGVTVCPGASAGIAALTLSALPAARWRFEGFLPHDRKERRARLEALRDETSAIVLYEAPHRLVVLLDEIVKILGDRRVCVARELTKLHESVITEGAADLLAYFTDNEPKGEFVVIVAGRDEGEIKREGEAQWLAMDIEKHVSLYLAQGLTESEAIKAAARDRGVPKRQVYRDYKLGGD